MRGALDSIAELTREKTRLTALVAQASEKDAALREVDQAERGLFGRWVADGCQGEAPELMTSERKTASEQLARAQAVAAGAESVIAEIDAKLAQAYVEARDLSAEVDKAVFAEMFARFGEMIAASEKAFAVARLKAVNAFGLRQALLLRANEMRGQGKDVTLSHSILHRLERAKVPDTDALGAPSNGEVAAAQDLALAEIRRLTEAGK